MSSAFNWQPWLSEKRIGGRSAAAVSAEQKRSEFHRDYDRIIFSSAFRRLSDKTQVVPFPQSDYTRRRLTHSLEVSCVGRSLATEIYSCRELRLADVLPQGDFEAIVATACLAHDIGNPPFGHFGEKAIQDWAAVWFGQQGSAPETDRSSPASNADSGHAMNSSSMEPPPSAAHMTDAQRADLLRFEGNAQSFRVLTRLQMGSRPGGMRLTAATLGAMIKYPRPSIAGHSPRYRKHGCFQDDLRLFQDVFQTTGQRANDNGEFFRHPLAWLSEAADDICYVIVDLEDGWKAGLISLKEATEILHAVGGTEDLNRSAMPDDRLAMARAMAINRLVGQCADVFRQNAASILNGTLDGSLIERCPSHSPYQQARQLVKERVFLSERVLELEAAGYQAIRGLLNMLVPAVLSHSPNQFEKHICRLARLESDAGQSVYQKILACTDYVSGMTDRFCVEQYQKLTGQWIL